MIIRPRFSRRGSRRSGCRMKEGRRRAIERGMLATDWAVALAILGLAMLPMAFAFLQEIKLCRAYYYQAAALEIIDGEMETLVAGEWRALKPGKQTYAVRAESARSFPPGKFVLTLLNDRARLEWIPEEHGRGGTVSREVKLK